MKWKFSVHKQSLTGTQLCSFVYVLSMTTSAYNYRVK